MFNFAAGNLDVVRYIMHAVVDNNPKDNDGKTPLHMAAMFGRSHAFKYMLENVHEKNPRDNAGNTPQDLAQRQRFYEGQRMRRNRQQQINRSFRVCT